MIKKWLLCLFLAVLLITACRPARNAGYVVSPAGEVRAETVTVDSFAQWLLSDETLRPFLAQKDELKIQIIYTQINRDAGNNPTFRDYFFNVNPAHYFYPASTVKMPAAILALEKMAKLREQGISKESTMITESAGFAETPVYNDPLAPDGRPTLAGYIRKVFLVSDNQAFNRIYEFLGQQDLNEGLRRKGHPEAEIIHRLQISLTEEDNRRTNPIRFYDGQGKFLWEQRAANNTTPHFHRRDSLGSGYMVGTRLVNGPMDFSHKNRIGLQSLHEILRSVIFPQSVSPEHRFQIPEDDRKWLVKTMGEFPTESRFPPYPGQDTASNKILFYGDDHPAGILPGLRIFNKTGGAYGFLLDVAYFADVDQQLEFMLSAVIYCNSDGVLNDDQYDYQTVGYPFMKALGRRIYQYELTRTRQHKPDLSEFRGSR